MEVVNQKIKSQVIKIHREDGGEDRVHLFLDNEGFLTGANGLEKLTDWKKNPHPATRIPGLRKDASGNVTADPNTQQMFRFFSKETPCWFPGCQELREAYDQELETSLANYEEDPHCSNCGRNKLKGKLINKYLVKVIEACNGKTP